MRPARCSPACCANWQADTIMVAAASDRINAAALLAPDLPARAALVCGERRIACDELRASVALAGAAWLDCEVLPGEVVMMRPVRDMEHAVAFLGAIWAGAVPMPLHATRDLQARHPRPPVRFVLDATRDGYVDGWRDSVMTLAEWRVYLGLSRPAAPVMLPPEAAACWTEARGDGGGARLLAHGFALAADAFGPRTPLGCVRVSGALGMLRVLRRGGTAVLGSPPGSAFASSRTGAELALP
jgi:hypothetical protein